MSRESSADEQDTPAIVQLWIELRHAIIEVTSHHPDIAKITAENFSQYNLDVPRVVYRIYTPEKIPVVLHAGSYLYEVKIRLITHVPIATLPPDVPLDFFENKILPIFVRTTCEPSSQFRFTCKDTYFPNALTLTMNTTVTTSSACPDAVRNSLALIKQQPRLSAQWEHWAAAPYEEVLGGKIPLMFG